MLQSTLGGRAGRLALGSTPPEGRPPCNSSTPAATLRTHCCRVQVVLVGVAHVSAKAQQDVAETITSVNPQVVVLELDKVRQHGRLCGAQRATGRG